VSLRFPYQQLPVGRPLVSLQGRTAQPRPLIPVTLIGPTGTSTQDALLDTGADDTVFPKRVAAKIGLDLSTAPLSSGATAGQAVMGLRYAQVTVRIADNQEQREWTAWVGFTPAKLRQPLLGFAGFLQYFTATFFGDREEVELAVNSLYAGT
jgi:predicted aspartyl protease